MKQYNCKNCGAPLEHSYNHRCPYCNSIFDFNEPKENTIEVKPEDLVNLELRSVEYNPYTNNLILMFSGYKCEMPKVYEYNGNNSYVSKVENYINPPKCGFCIEITLEEREKGIDYIMWKIRNTGIRYNELYNIKNQIISNRELRWWY